MSPAFLFVDPYGFNIPAGLLGDVMKAGRVELFINVMRRELDMLIQQWPAPGTPHAQTLDQIFGSGSWRIEVIGDGMDDRLERRQLMEGVLAAFAQFDNDCRSDRTRAGMKAALEQSALFDRPSENTRSSLMFQASEGLPVHLRG
jgi:hypothetical protein